LSGYCGSPALAELVARVGALLTAEPTLAEIDLNPVIVHRDGEGIVALDALMQKCPFDMG
ncbi:MAG: acetate--CoA ligase family protein, partial [Novosphingobium sp.]